MLYTVNSPRNASQNYSEKYHFISTRMAVKGDITTNVDEDVEKLLTPEIIGSNIKWFSHF